MATTIDRQLRPLTLGEILDQTVQLYRKNLLIFAGVAAVPIALSVALLIPGVAVVAMLRVAIRGGAQSMIVPELVFALLLTAAVPVYLAAYVYSTAGLTLTALNARRGERPKIRGVFKEVTPRVWTYLRLLMLQMTIVAIIPGGIGAAIIGALFFGIVRSGGSLGADFGLGFLVFLIGTATIASIVWFALSYSMGMAVCVTEKRPAWESLTRARQLSRGTRGRIFVLFLLIVVLSMVISMAGYMFSMIVAAGAAVMGKGAAFSAVAALAAGLLYALASIGGQILLTPVSWIALVLFYEDQRVRKEGYDIEWMMQQAGLEPERNAVPAATALPPDTVEER